jgi:hypothetical protein
MKKHTSVVTTGSDGINRLSPRNGFTAYFVVSPETGLFCLRRSRKFTAKFDTSVGVSGRYDFTVRINIVRLATLTRPPHPIPHVRDDREPPLFWG